MKFILSDHHDDVLGRLFKFGEDGRASIGTAKSHEVVGKLALLDEWTLFTDYLMEGFVSYYLRLSGTDDVSVLEVRFTGNDQASNVVISILIVCLTIDTFVNASDFERDVAPIFESRCLSCHNEEQSKGDVLT